MKAIIRKMSLVMSMMGMALFGTAQSVQWASELIDYSKSDVKDEFNGPREVLGEPSVYPGFGMKSGVWVPLSKDKEAFVMVEYAEPIQVRQVLIAEVFNPGAISKVYLYDESEQEYLVAEPEVGPITPRSRLLSLVVDETPYKVKAVKVVMDGKAVSGYNGIDCIGISGSDEPVSVEPKVADFVNPDVVSYEIPGNVNSPTPEIKPLPSPDGKYLFFSRSFHPDNVGGEDDQEDIWYSEWDASGKKWKDPVNAGKPVNTPDPNFISTITPNGLIVLGNRYKKSGRLTSGVSTTRMDEDGYFEVPTNLEIAKYMNVAEKADFYMLDNELVLLMAIDDGHSIGEMDLYASFLLEDGTWTQPLNLGETINSKGNEEGPYMAPDGKTIYFSTDGRSGYGGSDVYVSRRIDDSWTNWTEPENLGPGINSEDDDKFLFMPGQGDFAYYSQGNEEDGTMNLMTFAIPDFYKPEPVIDVTGRIFNKKTGEPVDSAYIVYERLSDGKEVGRVQITDGQYNIALPTGEQYGYLAEAPGFLALGENMDLAKLSEKGELTKDLYLVPVEKGASITLNNIFFDFDKASLKQESFAELNRLAKFMKENPDMDVEIAGHTDNVGTEKYNQKLSERRAKAVVDYLVKQGVDKKKVAAMGYGEAEPLNDNSNAGLRQANRRVEFKLLEEK